MFEKFQKISLIFSSIYVNDKVYFTWDGESFEINWIHSIRRLDNSKPLKSDVKKLWTLKMIPFGIKTYYHWLSTLWKISSYCFNPQTFITTKSWKPQSRNNSNILLCNTTPLISKDYWNHSKRIIKLVIRHENVSVLPPSSWNKRMMDIYTKLNETKPTQSEQRISPSSQTISHCLLSFGFRKVFTSGKLRYLWKLIFTTWGHSLFPYSSSSFNILLQLLKA